MDDCSNNDDDGNNNKTSTRIHGVQDELADLETILGLLGALESGDENASDVSDDDNDYDDEDEFLRRSLAALESGNGNATDDFEDDNDDNEHEFLRRSLAALESGDGNATDVSDDDNGDDEDEFFRRSRDIAEYLEFLWREEEGHEDDEPERGSLSQDGDEDTEDDEEEMEADDIDPDEPSDEEQMALGEVVVGRENKGLSQAEFDSLVRSCTFKMARVGCGMDVDRCVICQVEYAEGETLMALPCSHPYHADCISQWLQIKRVCPICSSEVSPP